MFVTFQLLSKIVGTFGDHYQGDMILNAEQEDAIHAPVRNGLLSAKWKWPNKVIIYQLSNDHSQHENDMIERALKRIESATCIKFKRRTDENDYIQVIVSS